MIRTAPKSIATASVLLALVPWQSLALSSNCLVETQQDCYGGLGLFASASVSTRMDTCTDSCIQSGSILLSIPNLELSCAPPIPSSPGKTESTSTNIPFDVTSELFPQAGTDRDVMWLMASLAIWRLQSTTGTSATIAIDPAIATHAQTLQWKDAQWHLPLLWSDETLQQSLEHACLGLEQQVADPLLSEVHERMEHLLRSSRTLANALYPRLGPLVNNNSNVHINNNDGESDADITIGVPAVEWACREAVAFVMSRTFRLPRSGRTVLLPIIDFGNHSDQPNAMFDDDDDDGNGDVKGIRLVALKEIHTGEEITISYGEFKSAPILFCGYGFVPGKLAFTTVEGRALERAATWGRDRAKSGRT